MEFDILILLLCAVSTHSAKSASKPSVAKSAIIAIEIVDPDEKPGSKNSKRTIESSLGYGYQDNSFGGGRVPPPKYQIYKYSQHDIPPYRGPSRNIGHQASLSRYQPGTTVYSTINQDGQVGTLSSQVPMQHSQGNVAVPVIILRVLPSQLASPSEHLFANIPQSNYLAPAVNSIDIKALLNRYLSQIGTPPAYSAPQYQPEVPMQYYQQQQPAYQQDYYQGYQQMVPVYQQQEPARQHQGPAYQQESAQHQSTAYQQEPAQQYQGPAYQQEPAQHLSPAYQQETAQYQGMQYLPVSQEKGNDLLTYENYPAKTHTRVVFRTPEGHVKTSSKSNVDDHHQQNYSQEPSQELDYSQYQDYDNNADYNEQQSEQYQQQEQQQQQQPVEHNQYKYGQNEAAASQNIIYVAEKDEMDDEEEETGKEGES